MESERAEPFSFFANKPKRRCAALTAQQFALSIQRIRFLPETGKHLAKPQISRGVEDVMLWDPSHLRTFPPSWKRYSCEINNGD